MPLISDDQLNVIAMTDSTGDVVERYQYGDYGELNIQDPLGAPRSVSALGNPYGFTGRWFDYETGYYYFRARYYDPVAGRFISRDPIGIWGDPSGLGNGYTYAGSNPWTYTDPSGLGRYFYQWIDPTKTADHRRYNSFKENKNAAVSRAHSDKVMLRYQLVIDTAAMLPGFEALDVVSAWMSFDQGDTVGVTVTSIGLGLSMVPVLGTVTGAGKALDTLRALRAAEKADGGKADEALEMLIGSLAKSADEQVEALQSIKLKEGQFFDSGGRLRDSNCSYASMEGASTKKQRRGDVKTNGETADTIRGKDAHKNYQNTLAGEGNCNFEQVLPSGKRVDAIDNDNNVVRELKPDNPRAIREGQKQLEGYVEELERDL